MVVYDVGVILARYLSSDRLDDLAVAFRRLALPRAGREYLEEKLPHAQVLLTGLSAVNGRFLKHLADGDQAPGREEFPSVLLGDPKTRPGAALVGGRRDQLLRLVEEAEGDPDQRELAGALRRLLDAPAVPAPLQLGETTLVFGERTQVMGILNITPDSFSDGGRFFDPEAAIAHGVKLVEEGADLLDLGGESTRPGSRRVDAEEELSRVLPVLRGLRSRVKVPLSIDTTKAEVARVALAEGATLVNDVSGFTFEPAIAEVAARAQAACCAMHMLGTPETMQVDPRYDDLVGEVMVRLEQAVQHAVASGVPREKVLVDPGIGFGKTFEHNLFLLRQLGTLRQLGVPIVLGTSRKAFLGQLTGGKPAPERAVASAASVAMAAASGAADIVRVHDVAETRDALAVADAVRRAKDGGAQFQ